MSNKFVWLGLFVALFFILYSLFSYQPIFAQTAACPTRTDKPRVIGGLISTAKISDSADRFSSLTGACVVDLKAPFTPYKIPTYDDLKSLYYTQAKTSTSVIKHDPLTGNKTQADIPLTGSNDHLYYVTGDLNINNNIPGNQSGIILVDGKLIINPSSKKITTSTNVGLVFVVKGDVNIDQSTTEIDAVIISVGTIYTAGAGCTTSSVDVGNALTVYGSLISLNQVDVNPIAFCRKLSDNAQPAEAIIQQPKYLVILRNLMSDTLQKWSEVQ